MLLSNASALSNKPALNFIYPLQRSPERAFTNNDIFIRRTAHFRSF